MNNDNTEDITPSIGSSNATTTSILDGFEFVPSDGVPAINLDKQRRFYVNSSAQKLLGIRPYHRLAILYDPMSRCLAIARPEAVADMSDAATSNYNVDKRYYMSARKFAKLYGYDSDKAPYSFEYDRGDSNGKVFVFRLRGADGAED